MFKRKLIYGISLGELLAVIGVYVLGSWLYRITIIASGGPLSENWSRVFDWWQWWDGGGLQYSLILLATTIVWLVIFRLFAHWRLGYRLLLHLLGLPLFIFFSWKLYYMICDYYGLGHLGEFGQAWDIYIPTLIYFVQFGAMHAYEYFVINQRKLRYEVELKNLALKNELSAIKAQLNPHFLYNVFNTINASVPEQMEETREMIAGLSDLFRYQLKASRSETVPLREELDFVRKYLELEKSRFRERLQTTITVAPELLDRSIPPMILQPLVENAVKHGISPKIDGGKVEVLISSKGEKLIFEVTDTGVGVEELDDQSIFENGIGLGNTQLRLKKMYNSSLQLAHNSPSGLRVSFEL